MKPFIITLETIEEVDIMYKSAWFALIHDKTDMMLTMAESLFEKLEYEKKEKANEY